MIIGNVIGDITSRRGRIEGQEVQGNAQKVSSKVPQSGNVWICNITLFEHTRTCNTHNAIFAL